MLYPHFSALLSHYHQPRTRIVLALSGGVDSRVLLHLLSLYKQDNPSSEYLAVHVHHGLSSNADIWAEKCRKWCDESGIGSVVERVKLNLTTQTSVEQEAREKRYKALEKHIQPGDLLLTGQHLSDQTETFLLALKRGSGPKGLASMPEYSPFSSGCLLRPLLSVSRISIVQYAEKYGLEWVEDESNIDIRYDRNFLRRQIVPELTVRWPNIERSVARSARLCADQEALLAELLSERLEQMVTPDKGLSVPALESQSGLARNQLIRMWLESLSSLMPTEKQLQLIWSEVAQAQQDANPRLRLARGEIRRFRDRLYFIDNFKDISTWHTELILNTPINLPDRLGSITLSNVGVESELTLRSAKPGETVWVGFEPEGVTAHPETRNHRRKLKKLFQEYGIPSWLRRRTPLIMYGERLAMVADLFVDREFSGNAVKIIWNRDSQGE